MLKFFAVFHLYNQPGIIEGIWIEVLGEVKAF